LEESMIEILGYVTVVASIIGLIYSLGNAFGD
jgi:hypothetical protein